MAQSDHARYHSTIPFWPVTFEYPADWQAEQSRGSQERYDQVQLFAPGSADARAHAYIAVRVMPRKNEGGRYASIEEMAAAYRQTQMPTLSTSEASQVTVLGVPALRMEVSGQMALPWKAAHPELIPMQGQRVFFEKDGRLFELSWMAPEESAPATAAAFGHVLSTLAPVETPLPPASP